MAAILPARPRKPKDKPKAEVGVQIVERWIIAVLRHRVFFNFHELNQAIHELVERLHQKPFQKLEGSRASLLRGTCTRVYQKFEYSTVLRTILLIHSSVTVNTYACPCKRVVVTSVQLKPSQHMRWAKFGSTAEEGTRDRQTIDLTSNI